MILESILNVHKGQVSKICIPGYIADNLAFELRDYQKEALARFLLYNDHDIYDTKGNRIVKSPHLLWQMATGSGKTLIMAALILEMYQKGYRNFWFFVSSTDIITKTIDNFTNASSKKYQFAPSIEIDGKRIEIRQVENFAGTNRDTFNIKFSTINILHQISQFEQMRENAVTLEDFADTPLVLIGDEAHHLNAATKKEKEEENSWERSVQMVLNANPQNRLFEFTATANLTNDNVAKKYENKLIYNYDLRHFRSDRFSKDVFTFSTDGSNEDIMLRAVLLSQYRKHIAAESGIEMKPVILFKSKGVAESKDNFEMFHQFVFGITPARVKSELKRGDNEIWNKVASYFAGKENELCEELKLDFAVSTRKVLLHDGTNKRIADQPKLLATLENDDNPVRAIFAVNMLQEGWDVLNLFDIVRLYDSRDGKKNRRDHYVAGKGTVSESQLIGRGARYFPFSYKNSDRYRRKFDDNETETLRVLEQMHYHCKHNPKYIAELRQTLVESGIMPGDDLMEITLKMKRQYIDGRYKKFQTKNVYVNQIIGKDMLDFERIETVKTEIQEQGVVLLPDFSKDAVLEIRLSGGFSQSQSLLDGGTESSLPLPTVGVTGTLSQFATANVLRYALNGNKNFAFDKLKKAYPKLESMSQFMKKLGEKKIKIVASSNVFSPDERVAICKEILRHLDSKIKEVQKQVIVSKQFYPQNAGKNFGQEIVRKYQRNEKLEVFDYDWYVYENSVLTSEEKSFVKWFADTMMTPKISGKTELEENRWSEIFLARNENAVKLFSWFEKNLGEGFEPDFVLFMKKDKMDYVFYIEPKGDWAYNLQEKNFGNEQWKEDFLLEIEDVVKTQQAKVGETDNWRLIGLPFYSENHTKPLFSVVFREKVL